MKMHPKLLQNCIKEHINKKIERIFWGYFLQMSHAEAKKGNGILLRSDLNSA